MLDDAFRVVDSSRIDDSRVGDRVTRCDLENAIADAVVEREVNVAETEPFGCSIVW